MHTSCKGHQHNSPCCNACRQHATAAAAAACQQVMVRSRHAPQRALGYRMLAAVLRRAQPQVQAVGIDGQLQRRRVTLEAAPPTAAAAAAAAAATDVSDQRAGANTCVTWDDVWQYAVVALRAVPLCRLGLDQDNAQVGGPCVCVW
jgi:hypothetical protein